MTTKRANTGDQGSNPGAPGKPTRADVRIQLARNQREAYEAARGEGLSDVAARALIANMTGESLKKPDEAVERDRSLHRHGNPLVVSVSFGTLR
jgi:hypothetical protein